MKKFMQMSVGAMVFLSIGLTIVPRVFALGFDNPDQDARATAQGEAFVAQADDASAIYYNPAGLTQLSGTEITSGLEFSFPDSRLKNGGSGTEMNTMATIPHLYVASDLGLKQSPWRFGIGFTVPFGNEAEFSPKNIQTRESRNELVFKIRASIPNQDGMLKRGLPVEVWR